MSLTCSSALEIVAFNAIGPSSHAGPARLVDMKRIWLLVAIVLLACMAWQLQRPAPTVVANEGQNPALVEQPEITSASPHLSTPANPEPDLPTSLATGLDQGADP